MSTRQPTPPTIERPRRDLALHRIGALLAAIAVVVALAAVSAASVGAAVAPTAPDDEPATDRRAAIAEVDPQAIATFVYHAPDVASSPWCETMTAFAGDWNGFADAVAAAADDWATTTDAMFELVGVTVQRVCPATAAAFLASTS